MLLKQGEKMDYSKQHDHAAIKSILKNCRLVATPKQEKSAYILIGCIAIACALLIVGCIEDAFGSESPGIPENVAVQCLLGEARSHGYDGMVLVAEVLRNRGNTKGMYGCTVKISEKEMAYMTIKGIIAEAHLAWLDSADSNITDGALYFRQPNEKIQPWHQIETYRHKNHIFYK